jgi:hypothetical protein
MEIETAGCVSDVCMVLAENVRVCVCSSWIEDNSSIS